MQMSSKVLFKAAVVILGMLLALGVFMSVSGATKQASALDATEWSKVRGWIDSYLNNQYNAADDGEAGYVVDATTLKGQIDSDGDGNYLDEGDDAGQAPVLVDVLGTWYDTYGGFVPGTTVRNNAGTAATTAEASLVAAEVAKHRAAGFNVDIVSYCLTGHSQMPPVAAYGVMAQAGYFGSPAPQSLGLAYGRQGWTTIPFGAPTYPGPNGNQPVGTSGTPGAYPLASTTSCTGVTPDSELARCIADVAITNIAAVGYGVNPPAAGQMIDLRSVLTGGTPAGAIQDPLPNVFSLANLPMLNNGDMNVFINRTAHSAGIAATDAEMLGYSATYIRGGLPAYNNTVGWPGAAPTPPGYATTLSIDTTAPSITSGPTTSSLTSTSVDVSRVTDESATSKITLTGSDSSTVEVNDTILNVNKTVSVTGLNPGVTYNGTLCVYDGVANGTCTAIPEFTTPCTSGTPALDLSLGNVYWASQADYNNRRLSIDYTISNGGSDTAYNVQLTGSTAEHGVTVFSGVPSTAVDIAGLDSATVTVVYTVPVGVGSFWTTNTAAADDECGTGYTYP